MLPGYAGRLAALQCHLDSFRRQPRKSQIILHLTTQIGLFVMICMNIIAVFILTIWYAVIDAFTNVWRKFN